MLFQNNIEILELYFVKTYDESMLHNLLEWCFMQALEREIVEN